MSTGALVIVMTTVFLWGAVSARLQRADLTAPIVFTGVGALLAALGLVHVRSTPETMRPLVELTLVWVLFADAARVRVQDLKADIGSYARLLAVGLPLTILLGWAFAAWLFPASDLWLALLVAGALAPTDAALGLPVVTNPAVPPRVRRLITVESGLNDGIATPVVMLAIAGVASAEALAGAAGLGEAAAQLAVGALVGGTVGFAGGGLLRWTRPRGWVAEGFAGAAVLALALVAYGTALVVHGNGFVAAFCGGLAFGATAGRRGSGEVEFVEQTSGLASLLVWLTFGAVAVPLVVDRFHGSLVVYAVLSLTVVRMLPVALASIGSGLGRATVLFVGWFGPRGLASLVFALLALEELGTGADEAVSVIAVTVLLSVIAHGASAAPLAARYGRVAVPGDHTAGPGLPELPVRGLVRHGPLRSGPRFGADHDESPATDEAPWRRRRAR